MKIHALLVGINDYNEIGGLNGCVDDVGKIGRYLEKNAAHHEIRSLLNEQATKRSIVNAFADIKQRVSKTDTFLFYFAGHGTLESAGRIWQETNGLLECIVCYDENPRVPSDFLLADKELRYLIRELSNTGCHIVTVFDCCHSGGNTRNLHPISLAFGARGILPRRHYHVFPQRQWSEFIFSSAIDQDDATGKQVNEFLPQGTHVQIAACESDEVAFEVEGEGVFTQTFLKVLEDCGSNISYQNLRNRIRQYLRFVYEQQPRIYTVGPTDEETQLLLFTRFLNNQEIDEDHFITEAVYNIKKGWLLNLGAIHGINADSVVELIDAVSAGKTHRASITNIFIDYTLLELPENAGMFPGYTKLRAKIQDFELNELKLNITKHEGDPVELKRLADALLEGAAGHFVLAENKADTDYELHVSSGLVYITEAGDPFRPIARPVEFKEYNQSITGTNRVTEYLKHISRWSYIKRLQNKTTFDFPWEPIKIDMLQFLEDGTRKDIHVESDGFGMSHAALHPFVRSSLSISLTNQTNQKLFVAVAYLSFNFQVYINLLEGKVELLDPGSTVTLGRRSDSNALISLKLPDVVEEYNWNGYTETLKIIISHEEFSHEALSLEALPGPYILSDQRQTRTYRSFHLEEQKKDSAIILEGWLTQTLHIRYPNIFYNKVEPGKVKRMLEWDRTFFFAQGLYDGSKKLN